MVMPGFGERGQLKLNCTRGFHLPGTGPGPGEDLEGLDSQAAGNTLIRERRLIEDKGFRPLKQL